MQLPTLWSDRPCVINKLLSLGAAIALLMFSQSVFPKGEGDTDPVIGKPGSDGGTCVPLYWTPEASQICAGEEFSQKSNCGSRTQVGISTSQNCTSMSDQGPQCKDVYWLPKTGDYCDGESFVQRSNCDNDRNAVGTGSISGCLTADTAGSGTDSGWFPDDSNVARVTSGSPTVIGRYELGDTRASEGGDHTFPVRITSRLTADIPLFLKTRKEFQNFLEKKAPNSYANAPTGSDDVSFCLETDYAPTLSTYQEQGTRSTACGTHTAVETRTCSFNTTGSDYPLCDQCDGQTLTRNINYTVTSTGVWSPPLSGYCTTQSVLQTNSCGQTRNRSGTQNCCTPSWSPNLSNFCNTVSVRQTDGCGASRDRNGTQSCCTSNWTPNLANYFTDQSVNQTDGCGNSRTRNGTKVRPVCTDQPLVLSGGWTRPAPNWTYSHYTTEQVGTNGQSTLHYTSTCGNTATAAYFCNNTNIGVFGCRVGDR